MEVDELEWDDLNVSKLTAHGISRQDIVEMVFVADAWVVDVHDDYPDQQRLIGPTPGGRFVTVALEPTREAGVWRPVTGWPSTEAEISYHRQEYR